MLTEKDTIKCESIFNEERTHRFLWKRVWNREKPIAMVITLNPCHADNVVTDTTSALIVNNIARLEEFGGVAVVNLFSQLTSKLSFRWNAEEDLNCPENDSYIKKTAEESGCIIAAWGKSADTNQRIADRANVVLSILEHHKEKVFVLSDGIRDNLHPLTPTLRTKWILKSFDWVGYGVKASAPNAAKDKVTM